MSLSKASLLPSPGRIRSAFGHLAGALAVVALASGTASASVSATYSFVGVTNTSFNNTQIGQNQLAVTVSAVALSSTSVDFTFTNTGANPASITDVYFDDGSLLKISSITNGPGVSFAEGATPPILPGGNAIDFQTSGVGFFTADSSTPVEGNGVNPSESLTITFQLLPGQTYAQTIAALNLSLQPGNIGSDVTGGLRIGIHVQAIGTNGNSESFVNGPAAVPEPASLATAGLGVLMGLGYAWRRKRASA